jgi:predicted aspartyl protease
MARLTTLLRISSLLALASAGTVQFDIARNEQVRSAQLTRRALQLQRRAGILPRAGTLPVVLTNAESEGLYFANVTVGTPGQPLQLQIDTGSSDVWVPATTASICSDAREGGCPNGECEFAPSFHVARRQRM